MDVGDDRDAHRARATIARWLRRARRGRSWAAAAAAPPPYAVPRARARTRSSRARSSRAAELDRIERYRAVDAAGSGSLDARAELAVARRCSPGRRRPLARVGRRIGRGRVRAGDGLVARARRLARRLARRRSPCAPPALVGAPLRPLRSGLRGLARRPGPSSLAVLALVSLGRGRRWSGSRGGSAALVVPGGLRSRCSASVVGARPAGRDRAALQPVHAARRPRARGGDRARSAPRLGVTVGEVEVADASRRTTAANAYVTGIGPTRRVVLYDTLLDGRFTPAARSWRSSAHELAHVARAPRLEGRRLVRAPRVPGRALVAWLVGAPRRARPTRRSSRSRSSSRSSSTWRRFRPRTRSRAATRRRRTGSRSRRRAIPRRRSRSSGASPAPALDRPDAAGLEPDHARHAPDRRSSASRWPRRSRAGGAPAAHLR